MEGATRVSNKQGGFARIGYLLIPQIGDAKTEEEDKFYMKRYNLHVTIL